MPVTHPDAGPGMMSIVTHRPVTCSVTPLSSAANRRGGCPVATRPRLSCSRWARRTTPPSSGHSDTGYVSRVRCGASTLDALAIDSAAARSGATLISGSQVAGVVGDQDGPRVGPIIRWRMQLATVTHGGGHLSIWHPLGHCDRHHLQGYAARIMVSPAAADARPGRHQEPRRGTPQPG